jgi:hypothetical protein
VSNLARKIAKNVADKAKREVVFAVTISQLKDGGRYIIIDPVDTPLPEAVHLVIGAAASMATGIGGTDEAAEHFRHWAKQIETGQRAAMVIRPDLPENPEDSTLQ